MKHILECHEIVKTDFVRGENCHLYDSQGKLHVDLESGIWSAVLGHGHPRVTQAMHAQMERVIHLGTRYPHSVAEEAALDVLSITGLNEGKCIFLSSGSEAVEFGAQAAKRVAGKKLFLTLVNSHLAAYGSTGNRRADEWHTLDWTNCPQDDPDECLREIPFDDIGVFAFEPGGSGGALVRFPPARLVQEIARRVQQAGRLVVANEVTTGMGRTGRWFGFQHYNVQPDVVCLGKGLGNGYPVSAAAMKLEIAKKLEDSGFHYAQSHQNDPLGCVIAREVIAVLRDGNWMERGNAIGTDLLTRLEQLAQKHSLIKEARGRGMLLGLELNPRADFPVKAAYRALLEEGFIVGYYPDGNLLRLTPALTIPESDISAFVKTLDTILVKAEATS